MLRGIGWDFYFANAVQIFPIRKHQKVPLKGLAWKEFDMWDYDWESHDGNIGLICGQLEPAGEKRLCVVDFDARKAEPYTIDAVPARIFHALDRLDTLRVATPRRGLHYYVYVPRDCGLSILKFQWGEIRGEGAYVLAPESRILRPEGDVKPYLFVKPDIKGFWDHIKDAPDELMKVITQRTVGVIENDPFFEEAPEGKPPFSASSRDSPPSDGGRVIKIEPSPLTIAAIVNGVGESESPCEGIRGRNDAAFHYAYFLIKQKGYSERETWKVLTEWNNRNRPPLPLKELLRTFQSACAYYVKRGGVIGQKKQETLSMEKPKTLWERLRGEKEEPEPIYPPLSFKGGITLLYGPPGEGKSFAMLRMGMAVAAKGKKVVYLSLEMAEPMVLRYVDTILQNDHVECEGEIYVCYKEEELAQFHDVDLLIIDSLRTFRPGVDLNDSKQVEALMQEVRRRYGNETAIVLLHHTNKSSMGSEASEIDPRAKAEGSLRLVSASDVAAFFHRDTTVFLIEIVKSRYTPTTILKRKFPFSNKQINLADPKDSYEW